MTGTPKPPHHLNADDWDEHVSPRPDETDFDRVVEARVSRRGLLGGALAFGSFAALGTGLSAPRAQAATDRFAFEAIGTSTADEITVPAGYKSEVLVRWGDPLWSNAPEFDHATRLRRKPSAGLW